MSQAQYNLSRAITSYAAACEKPASPWFLDALDRQIAADTLAWEQERRSTRRTLTIAWVLWGALVVAYLGFYGVYAPLHDAGLHP